LRAGHHGSPPGDKVENIPRVHVDDAAVVVALAGRIGQAQENGLGIKGLIFFKCLNMRV
jgi:hypothetical protein